MCWCWRTCRWWWRVRARRLRVRAESFCPVSERRSQTSLLLCMSISLTTSKPSRMVLCAYRRANMRRTPGTTIHIEISTSTGTTDGCLPQSLYFCPGERLCCCWMVVVYESNAKIFISTRALHSTTCSPTATWSSIHEKHHCLLARTFEPVYHPLDIGVRSIGDLSRSGQLHWRQQAQAYWID